ncbi:uncharacterized protein LOC111047878 [Nilaparvata lugens]|uniref:uncharacterized protein LOC111047878 n=1 Tax=Nilaparvata lugens TaxID=108931 RepID=UPI00193E4385|nr:uncharacterized protein LOC111047878 [Nilaparvata lugens]
MMETIIMNIDNMVTTMEEEMKIMEPILLAKTQNWDFWVELFQNLIFLSSLSYQQLFIFIWLLTHQLYSTTAKTDGDDETEETGAGKSCVNSNECAEHEWCMNSVCEDACGKLDCTSGTFQFECKVQNHMPICLLGIY